MIKKLFNFSAANKENRTIIAHAHIFKNAGTTIDWILQRNFGLSFLDDRNDQLIRSDKNYLVKLLSEKKSLKAFSSHSLPLPINKVENVEFQVICMLRHPLLRVRSVYDFERKQKANTAGAIFAKNATFSEYVAWRMLPNSSATIRNMHVRFLTANSQLSGELGSGHLEQAKKYIQSNPLIGLVEEFDQSMVVFEQHFGQLGLPLDFTYIKQNITKIKDQSDRERLNDLQSDLGEELYAQLLANNKLDMELYSFALGVLSKRFSSLSNAEAKLNDLIVKCETIKK